VRLFHQLGEPEDELRFSVVDLHAEVTIVHHAAQQAVRFGIGQGEVLGDRTRRQHAAGFLRQLGDGAVLSQHRLFVLGRDGLHQEHERGGRDRRQRADDEGEEHALHLSHNFYRRQIWAQKSA
jgi:hypothetical protein